MFFLLPLFILSLHSFHTLSPSPLISPLPSPPPPPPQQPVSPFSLLPYLISTPPTDLVIAIHTLPIGDGPLKEISELLLGPQVLWPHKVHHAPVFHQVVLERVARHHHTPPVGMATWQMSPVGMATMLMSPTLPRCPNVAKGAPMLPMLTPCCQW